MSGAHTADNPALGGDILGISEAAAWVLRNVIKGISGVNKVRG